MSRASRRAARERRRNQDKPWGVGGWLLMILLGLPIAAAFTLMSGAAVLTTVVWSWQSQFGPVLSGTLVDTSSHTVHSRRGPDETYCYGLFAPADGRPQIRVRVYTSDDCYDAQGLNATYVPAVGRAISEAIVPPDDADGTMAFNGLYGMSPGAVVDGNAFVVGLWPFLFILPFAVFIDLAVVGGMVEQVRRRKNIRARAST